jgi:uncharacterized YigZ family protein
MIDSYLSLKEPVVAKITRKKSRFIALLYPVASEEKIPEILKEVRHAYHDASHRCYAYRLMGESSPIVYTNDAGEPSGSAGGPILAQVEGEKLYDVLAVVVRYFGGKKLGLGGLIRAYADATKKALFAAMIVEKHREVKLAISFPSEINSQVMGLIHRHPVRVEEVAYDDEGRVLIAIPPSCVERFTEELKDATGARARWKEEQ